MIPKTKQRNAMPGDKAVIFMIAAIDDSGKKWPRGTVKIPKCGGFDNTTNSSYVKYTDGVIFHGEKEY